MDQVGELTYMLQDKLFFDKLVLLNVIFIYCMYLSIRGLTCQLDMIDTKFVEHEYFTSVCFLLNGS